MSRRALLVITAIAVPLLALPLLSGCTPETPAGGGSTSAPSTEPATAAPAPEPDPEPAFVAPTTCSGLVGSALETEFAAKSIVLFDSSVGGGIYTGASEGPKQDGGQPLFCLYGIDMVDLSTFQLEAQGLTQQAHEGVVATLEAQGLAKTVDGDIVTYTQVGDEMGTPALVHVLRPDSWLTASSSFGGDQQVTTLTGYLTAMATQVYPG